MRNQIQHHIRPEVLTSLLNYEGLRLSVRPSLESPLKLRHPIRLETLLREFDVRGAEKFALTPQHLPQTA